MQVLRGETIEIFNPNTDEFFLRLLKNTSRSLTCFLSQRIHFMLLVGQNFQKGHLDSSLWAWSDLYLFLFFPF